MTIIGKKMFWALLGMSITQMNILITSGFCGEFLACQKVNKRRTLYGIMSDENPV